MVLNLAGALLNRDPRNADRLQGDSVTVDLQLASDHPPSRNNLRTVPGHDSYVIYPYVSFETSPARCRQLGERCGVTVEIEISETPDLTKAFWRYLKTHAGGLPGQSANWSSRKHWTARLNDGRGDRIGVSLTDDKIRVYLRSSEYQDTPSRAARMLQYSRKIRQLMGELELSGNEEHESKAGRSITVRRGWDYGDEDGWLEAARWIKDQADRLQVIAESLYPIKEQIVD